MAKNVSKKDDASLVDDSFITSVVISVVLALLVMSFSSYYWFVPPILQYIFGAQVTIPGNLVFNYIIQVFYVIGWIALIVVPPYILGKTDGLFTKKQSIAFLTSAITFSVAVILIKIGNLASFGNLYIDYLAKAPILAFMEYLAPAYYVLVWFRKKPVK